MPITIRRPDLQFGGKRYAVNAFAGKTPADTSGPTLAQKYFLMIAGR